MRERGFTLVELVVVMAIMAILLTVGVLRFNDYRTKSEIEAQTKMILADLSEARVQALFQKRPRSVVIAGTQFAIYSSSLTSVAPLTRKTLKYAVQSDGSGQINFDARGLVGNIGTGGRSLCLTTGENPATIDSIVLSTTRIYSGKWKVPGGSNDDCISANIDQQ